MTDANEGVGSDTSSAVTVLIVGSDAANRRSATELLQTNGCSVATASDGFEALAAVVERQPALILAEIVMPRLDGYLIVREVASSVLTNTAYNP